MTTHDTPTQQRDDAYRIATTPGAVIMFGEGRDDYIVPGGIWRRLLNALTRHEQTQGVNEQPTPSTIMPHDSHTPEPTQANESMQAPSVVMGLAHAQPQAQQPAGAPTCWHCNAPMIVQRGLDADRRKMAWLGCQECGVDGPSMVAETDEAAEAEAVAAWNRRAANAEASADKRIRDGLVDGANVAAGEVVRLVDERDAALRRVEALRDALTAMVRDCESGETDGNQKGETLKQARAALDAEPVEPAPPEGECPACGTDAAENDRRDAKMLDVSTRHCALVAAVRELLAAIAADEGPLYGDSGKCAAHVESLLAGAEAERLSRQRQQVYQWEPGEGARALARVNELIERHGPLAGADAREAARYGRCAYCGDHLPMGWAVNPSQSQLCPACRSNPEATRVVWGEQPGEDAPQGELNLTGAIRQLREAGGHGWDNVQDVEATIADMRGTDDMPLLPPAPPQPEGEGE